MQLDLNLVRRMWQVIRNSGTVDARYLLTAGPTVAVAAALYGVVRGFQELDDWVVPPAASATLAPPLLVVGNPRSGTTFLHRLLNRDAQFRSLALYETLFPSGLLQRFIRAAGHTDRGLGRPVGRLLGWLEARLFGGWKGIHRVSFDEAEEDEMFFLYALRSPAFMILHPALVEVPELRHPDALPAAQREQLATQFRTTLLRQAWASHDERPLLIKNALAAGRMGLYRDVAPNLRLVLLVRHPYQSIPSMVSMFSRPWRLFHPDWAQDGEELRRIAQLACDYYRELDAFASSLPPEQVVEVDYDELVADPEAVVRTIYTHFGLPLSSEFASTLAQQAARAAHYRSVHHYDLASLGLSEAWIRERLADVFERRGFS